MKTLLLFIALGLAGCANSSAQTNEVGCGIVPNITRDANKKDMLVLGDSLSLGYTPFLRTDMPDYNIFHNPCNGAASAHEAININYYLSLPHYNLITFNAGIWDIAASVTDDEYRKNLITVITAAKAKTDRLVFITTTFNSKYSDSDTQRLRAVAAQVMQEQGVEVVDIYDYSQSIVEDQVDGVHFNAEGYTKLAEFIKANL